MIAQAERRLRDALHVAVVNATRRMTDRGLRDRVLAAEGRHVHSDTLAELLGRRWVDEFGNTVCPCGRRLTDLVTKVVPDTCRCGGRAAS